MKSTTGSISLLVCIAVVLACATLQAQVQPQGKPTPPPPTSTSVTVVNTDAQPVPVASPARVLIPVTTTPFYIDTTQYRRVSVLGMAEANTGNVYVAFVDVPDAPTARTYVGICQGIATGYTPPPPMGSNASDTATLCRLSTGTT